ncbi:MAG: HIT domain-containing protein, partial [Deltaproteobacteria bacterium]|nr:HIT domain-containing protein [Deltaproteobacteria bacterium]
MDCIFCKIINGEIPSEKVYEDDKVFAFMDINPLNDGHVLIIPKSHAGTIHEIGE